MTNKIKSKTNIVKETIENKMGENKLQTFRTNKNMSQSELAKKSGISVRTIQDLEQGRRKLNKASFEMVYKLAAALKCDIKELYDKDDE